MVAHGFLHVAQRKLAVGNHVEGHGLGIVAFALYVVEIVHGIFAETVEESPHTSLAHPSSAECQRIVGLAETELLVGSAKTSRLASELDDILTVHHVEHRRTVVWPWLLVDLCQTVALANDMGDAALVGMPADGVVGNAHGSPYGFLRARSATDGLHDPSLVRIAYGERLPLSLIAVTVGQLAHDLDGFAGCSGALQRYAHHRGIIHCGSRVLQFFSYGVGTLSNSHLPLVDVADGMVGVGSLRNLAVRDT